MEEFIDLLSDALPGKKREITVLIPYANSKEAALLHDGEVILSEDYTDAGIKITLLADDALYPKLKKWEVM